MPWHWAEWNIPFSWIPLLIINANSHFTNWNYQPLRSFKSNYTYRSIHSSTLLYLFSWFLTFLGQILAHSHRVLMAHFSPSKIVLQTVSHVTASSCKDSLRVYHIISACAFTPFHFLNELWHIYVFYVYLLVSIYVFVEMCTALSLHFMLFCSSRHPSDIVMSLSILSCRFSIRISWLMILNSLSEAF